MVAVIKTGSSVRRLLNYNENKVRQGVARCIEASNYPMDADKLSVRQKLSCLVKQAALNENVKRSSVHISLNFGPGERVGVENLKAIADTYMQGIGFGRQPYLVYEHYDAGHPHIHIVTINIRADGSRIDMQNIGRNRSEKARKEIEQSFGLVRAGQSGQKQNHRPEPIGVTRVRYGKTETKKAIGTVLDFVLKNYRYASLPELNAVLGQYNVRADCGKEDPGIRQNGGLAYGVLDEAGNRVGVPIKAGDFPGKPMLAFLQSKYAANDVLRQPHKSRVRNAVDQALSSGVQTLSDLKAALAKEGIGLLPRQNPEGVTYGLTYIDHTTHCVFNGSALGKAYSAKAVLERCSQSRQTAGKTETGSKPETLKAAALRSDGREHGEKTGSSENQPLGQKDSGNRGIVMEALDALLKPEHGHDYVPNSLKKRRRKKKKKRISNQP